MDYIKSLEPDEISVELEIRSIEGSDPTQNISLLEEALSQEESKLKIGPMKPHQAASKNPKTELVKCREKLKPVQLDLAWGLKD